MSPSAFPSRRAARPPALALVPPAAFLLTLAVFVHTRWNAPGAARGGGDAARLMSPVEQPVVAAVNQTLQTVHGRSVVVVTAVNNAFRHYLLNLNCSLAASGRVQRLLVVALDSQVHDFALRAGFHSVHLEMGGVEAGDSEFRFGSKAFNLLSKQKLYAVYRVLQTGVDVLFVDADIVWCTDVTTEVVQLMYGEWGGVSRNRPHMLMQTAWPRSLLNSGFYYARASEELRHAFRLFLAYDADSENDQVIVNRVLCNEDYGGEIVLNGSFVHPAAPHRLMPALCRRDGVEVRVLGERFPTGGDIVDGMKIFHLPRRRIVQMCANGEVALLHNNCILSIKKKARFVVKGIWYVAEGEEEGEGEGESGTCLDEAAPATLQMRKRCGGPKCGPEGDLKRYKDLIV